MLKVLFIVTLIIPLSASSQKYFDKTKDQVRSELEKYISANKELDPSLSETDSTLILSVKEPRTQSASFVYGFAKGTGKCSYQKTIANCDSCYKKYLDNLLKQKTYGWIKLNGNQYVSKFSGFMLIELPLESDNYSFTVFKAEWTKELYDILIKK